MAEMENRSITLLKVKGRKEDPIRLNTPSYHEYVNKALKLGFYDLTITTTTFTAFIAFIYCSNDKVATFPAYLACSLVSLVSLVLANFIIIGFSTFKFLYSG